MKKFLLKLLIIAIIDIILSLIVCHYQNLYLTVGISMLIGWINCLIVNWDTVVGDKNGR